MVERGWPDDSVLAPGVPNGFHYFLVQITPGAIFI